MSLIDLIIKPKRECLHFGDDFVIRNVRKLKLKNKYLFDEQGDRAWPLIHKVLLTTNGKFPYLELITNYGFLDPFNTLTAEERKTAGDGKQIAKDAIREVMHANVVKSANHTVALMLGFVAAVVFIIILVMVLLFLKGKLNVT